MCGASLYAMNSIPKKSTFDSLIFQEINLKL